MTCGASSVPSFSARPDNRRMLREEEAGTWNRYSQKGWSAMFEDVDAEAEVVEAAGAACQDSISFVLQDQIMLLCSPPQK